jgi:ArsR family transcriptional regulator, arsenate/arsenite/antimonite-responsive transcriptional repressor
MTATLKKLEKISKALGDVNRLKILRLIAEHGGIGQCASIQACINLAQPSVSHHIKILTEAGLIEAEKEGRNHKYILNSATVKEYMDVLTCLTKTRQE